MNSEPRPSPFRMPGHLFAELAAGGGSAQAVAFLERGERARRLLLLRTLLDHLESLPTPSAPAAEAWRVFKEAAERAPEPVERLLLAPTTGAWIAHMLRRVHGTASGPPLWAEAGRLGALAVAAALHAGTETVLRVPLTDGALSLPGLGLARLPHAAEGLTTGSARTRAGELTLTGPGRDGRPSSLTCRPAPVPVAGAPRASTPAAGSPEVTEPRWLPLRTLTHTTPEGPVAIPLEDLDPYRDLDDPVPPARLDADEALAWQRLFDEAVAILAQEGGAGPGRLDPALIRSVVPWARTGLLPPPPPDVRVSASSGDAFGAMVIARPSSALALAEALVHEFQHSKLAALIHLFPLLDDDRAERHYAPWRPDPRHLTGLLHGAYAFTGVAGFWRDRLAAPEHAETAAYHFALRRTQSRLVVRTLLTSGRLTAVGHGLVTGLARTLDGWLREPVDPAALARARTAAALHRTEWRLRNVAPASPSPSGTLRLRPDRTPWPDIRTHAFATRPAAPRTPDEHLAAGDAATALDGYAESLARAPGDPHLLAGWIVARAALEPGHAARRLLARPELHQPQRAG
ncbi:hypothetical protein SUDANB176_05661 [Streptomyces sp. enrichment culture]|uniref:HEXXH motif domain-containing protein n=1 Tax=Streptomyces sp. enrichment culture TaxID=1795815 RepID=UPI003F576580